MGNKRARVYSYLRFSDSRQATGSSVDRQQEYARRWATDKGLELDAELSMRDEGLSAYHQQHIKQGALGVFLAAIEVGRIAPGSVLVVEGLDRLSRAEPILAQAQLAQVINAGITVVTASDGKAYNRQSLKESPMDLVYSLLVMIRAHEESDTKSKRVRAAIRRQCEQWQAGTYRGPIRNGRDPHWIARAGDEWVLVPEYAEGILAAIDLIESGLGAVRVLRELNQRGLKVSRGNTSASHFYRVMRTPSLVGHKSLSIDGESYILKDYYPALITPARFEQLQLLMDSRTQVKGQAEIPGLITGIKLAYCGYCGASMGAQNMTHRKRPDGSMAEGHRRIICVNYSHAQSCPAGSMSVGVLERALMRYCSDQMNLNRLLQGNTRLEHLQSRAASLRSAVIDTERQLNRITEALLSDDGAAPIAFVRKARELEDQLQRQQAELAQADRELAGLSTVDQPALADAWSELREGVEQLDRDARLKARRLVLDTFERIAVYTKGAQSEGDRWVDMMLVPKGGIPRLLRINRRTGELMASAEG